MNIYVGNMSGQTAETELRTAFEAFGDVTTVNIITDRVSGESRGFAFVEMPAKEQAQAAITGLNGSDLGGRALMVNEARPRNDKASGGGNGRSW